MASKRHTLNGVSEDDRWKVESDLRTLVEAEVIQKDKARLKKARALAKEKMLEAAAIASGDAE